MELMEVLKHAIGIVAAAIVLAAMLVMGAVGIFMIATGTRRR